MVLFHYKSDNFSIKKIEAVPKVFFNRKVHEVIAKGAKSKH
jgi:hypothetical protein